MLKRRKLVIVDLDQAIPAKHRLRRLNKVLHLSFLYALTKKYYCENMGRPSIDPVIFFKMMIIKHLYGITSDRQLCEDIQVNLAYRWFVGLSFEEKVPDHSSVTRIRDRLSEEFFKQAFELIIKQCRKAGLVKGEQMITDATLIEANASKKSLVKRMDHTKTDKIDPKQSHGENSQAKSGVLLKYRERISFATHVSKTDPDSSVVGRATFGKKLYYKAHVTIDSCKRVVTDCHITTGATHECKVFIPRIDHQLRIFHLRPHAWLADRGYGHGPTYEYLRNKKIRTYIPLRDAKLGHGKHAPTKGFNYDRIHDVYTCPMGYVMRPHKPTKGMTRYRITGGQCKNCLHRQTCMKNLQGFGSKRIQRSIYQDDFDNVHRRCHTNHFHKKLCERAYKIEGLFGELKERHGFRRAQYRGLPKMQIQAYLAASVCNLKRLTGALMTNLSSRPCNFFLMGKTFCPYPESPGTMLSDFYLNSCFSQ